MNHDTPGRRRFLRTLGISTAALPFAVSAQQPPHDDNLPQNSPQPQEAQTIPFYGSHQAGIVTPAQKHLYFLSADLHSTDPGKIRDMFKLWTTYAANLCRGSNIKSYGSNSFIPPADTGEADGLHAHRLTLTFGIGPDFLHKLGMDHLRPTAFKSLPHFPRDQLQSAWTGGDICIQACADDPQVAFHAVRNLVRTARTLITPRWAQPGFNAYDHPADTPRNLFAFKDGTANKTGNELDRIVWVDEKGWLKGGTYLVARRIKMFTETWDRTSLAEQNNTFGRARDTGAAFGAQNEHDPVDLSLQNEKGKPLMPADSHVRLAHATGHNMLRRSFSYVGGIDTHGQFDTGLMFISYQRDPQIFIDIQNAFGNTDRLNEYITHTGSALFACFAGIRDQEDSIGSALFAHL